MVETLGRDVDVKAKSHHPTKDWGPGAPKPVMPSDERKRDAKRAKRAARGERRHEAFLKSKGKE